MIAILDASQAAGVAADQLLERMIELSLYTEDKLKSS